VNHKDVVLFGQRDDFFEEGQLHALGGGVAGKAQHHHLGLGVAAPDGALQLGEKVHPGHQRHAANVGPGDHRAVDVNRVAGVGHQHGVAPVQRGQHQVRQTLFGPDGDDGLGVGVDRHAVTIRIPVADGAAQAWNAFAGRVAVGIGALDDLGELGHDVGRGGPIGVAHAQVDDVFATAAGGEFELGRDVEDVGGKAVDARETALA
jgi:hypothetical protein